VRYLRLVRPQVQDGAAVTGEAIQAQLRGALVVGDVAEAISAVTGIETEIATLTSQTGVSHLPGEAEILRLIGAAGGEIGDVEGETGIPGRVLPHPGDDAISILLFFYSRWSTSVHSLPRYLASLILFKYLSCTQKLLCILCLLQRH